MILSVNYSLEYHYFLSYSWIREFFKSRSCCRVLVVVFGEYLEEMPSLVYPREDLETGSLML